MVEKAEGDWNAAQQLNRVRKNPNYDSVSFHCQQCIEKYEEAGVNVPKSHDLIKWLGLVITVEPPWIALHPFIATLNPYAVGYRYPGLIATKADARAAIKDCKEVRRVIRAAFGLPV
ncbi:MAG: HEPN domain-containing protein [Chloracidobacterium sp.]|nr:HEPN domain-containing protein [Chloracidobacterium sp.]